MEAEKFIRRDGRFVESGSGMLCFHPISVIPYHVSSLGGAYRWELPEAANSSAQKWRQPIIYCQCVPQDLWAEREGIYKEAVELGPTAVSWMARDGSRRRNSSRFSYRPPHI